MLRILTICVLLLPVTAFGVISKSDLIGEWVWLGNSFERTSDYGSLSRTGPSIMRFSPNGEYEYISVFDGEESPPVLGSWKYKKGILSITRPDNGTINYKILSYIDGILETQDTYMESYMYMKKKK